MNVVFRVDAALHIGSGHVMRCLTLADELKQRGANCIFICREFSGNLFSLIQDKGYELYSLPCPVTSLNLDSKQIVPHEHWLGVSYQHDALQTIAILETKNLVIDWLIVDHYAIDIRWEELIRPYTKKIMLIDDLADRVHDCDLLLDQNYFDHFQCRYDSLVPCEAKKLLGPQYVLLKPAFRHHREKISNIKKNQNQILVFFGGVDRTGETLKLIKGFKSIIHDYFLHIVVGNSNPHYTEILKETIDVENIKLYRYVDDMAELMANMDYSFGACGSTNWERMCIGLNCAIVSVAENQVELSLFLQQEGLIDYLGSSDQITEHDYRDYFEKFDIDSSILNTRRHRIMEMVDGLGVDRVVFELIGEQNDPQKNRRI